MAGKHLLDFNCRYTAMCIASIAVVILFQPFAKVYLGRGLWNVMDVLLAVALIWQWVKWRD